MSVGADIGGGLYIAHPVGCVLMAEGIGSNVTVISQVTFGTRNDGRWPTIGDDTFFGVGARVLGGVAIGRAAQVGANAVVLTDVAPRTTVVGIPARPVVSRVEPGR
jgi:serine O-acetyltransferase